MKSFAPKKPPNILFSKPPFFFAVFPFLNFRTIKEEMSPGKHI